MTLKKYAKPAFSKSAVTLQAVTAVVVVTGPKP